MISFTIRELEKNWNDAMPSEEELKGLSKEEADDLAKNLAINQVKRVAAMAANGVNVGYAVYDILATAGVGYLVNDLVDAIAPDTKPGKVKTVAKWAGKIAVTCLAKKGVDTAISNSLAEFNKFFDEIVNALTVPVVDETLKEEEEAEESENE